VASSDFCVNGRRSGRVEAGGSAEPSLSIVRSLTIGQAGERAGSLASPEMRHLLINGLGWTPEQHTD
jgi:hypothetical protein